MTEVEINCALLDFRTRRPDYELYEDYFDGKHRMAFATEKFRTAFGHLFATFADNVCPAIVEPVADRLEVKGFTVEDGPEQAADAAWDIWQGNRMDQRSGEVHLEALRAGDAYVIVWPDGTPGRDNEPIIYPQQAKTITVAYDAEAVDQINWAAKAWATEDRYVRLNMYYADRIEKYRSKHPRLGLLFPDKADAFEPFQIEGEQWPQPNPYGQVPVFHFPNNSDIGKFGRSELQNVIPLQDAKNKTKMDMMVAMEFRALPQRYATGIEVRYDEETGLPIPPWDAGADRIIVSSNPDAKFGEFSASDISQFTTVDAMWNMDIARVSRTPTHYLMAMTGNWPSGESLKTAEAPFVAKVRDRQMVFGNVWESAMMFANKIANAPEARLSATWNDPSPRSDRDHIEQLVRKHLELGIPRHQVWREAGYSDDQVDSMEEERAVTDEERGARLMRAAMAGGVDREV